MQEPVRATLWQLHASLAVLPTRDLPAALAARAGALGLAVQWHAVPLEPVPTAAVRVAHALGMGQRGLQAWHACWGEQGAALRLAAVAAPLLAGRADLQLLVAPAGAGMESTGAWVDGESCARMAVAGHDPEIELQLDNCVGLLASSGDLRDLAAPLAPLPRGRRFLIIGLKGDAAAGH
jgi:hypothetical protein